MKKRFLCAKPVRHQCGLQGVAPPPVARARVAPKDTVDPATCPPCNRCGEPRFDIYDWRPVGGPRCSCAVVLSAPFYYFGRKVRSKGQLDGHGGTEHAFRDYEVVSVDREVRAGLSERWCQLRKGDHHIRTPLSTIEPEEP